MKKLFIWLFAGQLICALITALICYFFDYWVIRKAVDIAFFVGAGVVFLGFSAAQNASTEDFEIYLSTRYTGEGRGKYNQSQTDDMIRGINFGWFMVFSGFMWALLSFAIYYFLAE